MKEKRSISQEYGMEFKNRRAHHYFRGAEADLFASSLLQWLQVPHGSPANSRDSLVTSLHNVIASLLNEDIVIGQLNRYTEMLGLFGAS